MTKFKCKSIIYNLFIYELWHNTGQNKYVYHINQPYV